jgi:hypothetical protein
LDRYVIELQAEAPQIRLDQFDLLR